MTTLAYSYDEMLAGVYSKMNQNGIVRNEETILELPSLILGKSGRTLIFSNFSQVCQAMNRLEQDLMKFLTFELSTTITLGMDGLYIKGNFRSRQIENLIIKYINQNVKCKDCKSFDTCLKGKHITCQNCQVDYIP